MRDLASKKSLTSRRATLSWSSTSVTPVTSRSFRGSGSLTWSTRSSDNPLLSGLVSESRLGTASSSRSTTWPSTWTPKLPAVSSRRQLSQVSLIWITITSLDFWPCLFICHSLEGQRRILTQGWVKAASQERRHSRLELLARDGRSSRLWASRQDLCHGRRVKVSSVVG